jgi:hypothetical protein
MCVRRPACWFVCLSANLPFFPFACLPACRFVCLSVCPPACLPKLTSTRLPACPLPACLSAFLCEIIDDFQINNRAHLLILQKHDCGVAELQLRTNIFKKVVELRLRK